ncbi:MAG: hypothetical protein ACHQ50_05660 [Fimbriimonadales bacterium]
MFLRCACIGLLVGMSLSSHAQAPKTKAVVTVGPRVKGLQYANGEQEATFACSVVLQNGDGYHIWGDQDDPQHTQGYG